MTTPTTADITGVTAGTGLSGGGTSGTVTLNNTGVTSIVAGSNISISGATGAVTVTGTDTNTQLSTEEVQDIVGAMVSSNTESGIAVTYEDGDGTLDFAVTSQTDNNFTTTLKNKLDAIEASATADQTAAEIRTLVEAATDSNVFTDTDHSKLDGIEASATADQTAAEIRTLVESASDSNVFTDDDHTKLNAIEASATADQTASEIRTLVESASDSNVFTDADHSKLDGVAASANNYAISSDLLDEDNMASNSATKVASQQSIKAYVDAEVAGVVDSAPAALNTLNELAAALGDDANYATTTSTALGNRLRTDVDSQGLTSTQQGNALTNLGITATKAEINILDDGLSASDIPSLAASKITSGTFATARIADDAITAGKLNVSGDGSATQFLRSDGDGSFSWAVPTDTNTQLTQEQVEDFVAGVITAGSNVSVTYDDAAGTLTIASTDTNTQLTTEAVQDIVGAMFSSNTETRISATYEDGDGTIDLVVDDMTANTQLTTEEVQDIVGAMFTSNTETRITATYQDGDGTIDLVVDDQSTDNNTTYSISAVDGDNSDEEKIRLTDSGGTNDDIVLEAGTGLSVARSGDKITFTNTVTDTNTQLSTEQVQDIVGAMFSSNTETRVSATYQDGDGTIDLVVDDMTADTNTQLSQEQVEDYIDGLLTAGSNISLTYDDAAGTLTIAATDTNTQLSTEQVQDIVGAMFSSNTETRISATYEDGDGTIDLVVDDMTANDNTFRPVTAGGNTLGSSETLAFTAGSNVTITESGGAVTIASTDTNTNTQLSDEQVQDIVGAMFSSNTETGITATYQDGDGTVDLVVGTLNQDTTGTASKVTVSDSTANTNFPVVFHDESNALLDDTGALRYNPSTGTLLVPNLNVAGTTTQVDTVTMEAANAVIFEGATADAYETTLTITDPTADRTITLPNASGTVSLSDTQLSTEQVQDIVGAMFSSNTETRISATYEDGDGTIDLVVDDMTANDNTFRTITAGGNTLGASETLAFTAGSNVTITESGGAVTIASADTNTQLSTEAVQDIVGAMFTSNTETRISATYEDGDGTIDLVVDDLGGASDINGLSDGKTSTYSLFLGVAPTNTQDYNVAVGIGALDALNGTNGTKNVAIGYNTLTANTEGFKNVAIGYAAGSANTDADQNTFVGSQAGTAVTTGGANTAIGCNAAYTLTTGTYNTFVGALAGDGFDTESENTAIGYGAFGGAVDGGDGNVAIGMYALDGPVADDHNIGIGVHALSNLAHADDVIGIGHQAGFSITTGNRQVLIGAQAGYDLTDGSENVMIGYQAGTDTTGSNNTFIGTEAGYDNHGGASNVFVGKQAGYGSSTSGSYNTGLGTSALNSLTSGGYNISIGPFSGDAVTEGSRNIFIGNQGGNNVTTGNNNVVIGNADVSSATGHDQLSISSGDGSPVWMTGDSSGVVDFPNGLTNNGAAISNTNQLTTFTLTGDSGSDQTIAHGNTLDIAGGTGIDTVVGATDTVTVAIDSTVATLTGTQTLTNKTLTSPTLGGNLDTAGYDIVSTSNQHIDIAPHGTGDVRLQADTVQIGDSNTDVKLTTNGTGDLTIDTNSGTNSGSIVIADGANNDITLTPNGTGDLILDGLKWPQADGSANYVLKTDGSAQLSWTEMSGGGGGAPSVHPMFTNKVGSAAKYYPIGYEHIISGTQRTLTFPTNNTYFYPFRADYTGTVTGLSIYTIGGTAPDPSEIIVAIYDSDSDGAPKDRQGHNTFDTSGVSSGTYINDTSIDDDFATTAGEIYWLAVTATGSSVGLYGWDRKPMRIASNAMPIFYWKYLRFTTGGAVPASSVNTALLYQGNVADCPNMVMTYSGL